MPNSKRNDDAPVIRPFADFLREQGKGHSHEELSDALHDLIARVQDTGKKGSLTYVVTVGRLKDGGEMLVVSDEIKLRLPEHDRDASLYFTDRDGNLSRNDPNQLAFESLRALPPPAGVDLATGEIREGTDNT